MREFQNKFDLDGLITPPKGVTIESVRKVQKLVSEARRGSFLAEGTLKDGLISESAMTGTVAASVAHFLNIITIPQLPEDKDRPVAKLATFETVPDFRPAILYGLFGDLTGPGIESDGAAAVVPQGTPFPEVTITGVESAYGKLRKRGARIGWDFEDFINDTVGVLDRIPSELRDVALETEWQEVGDALIKATTTAGSVTLPDGTTTVPDNAPISANAIMAAIQALAERTVNGSTRKIGTLSSYKVVVPTGKKVFVDYMIRQALGIMYVLPGSSGGSVLPPPDNSVLANVEVIEHSKVTGTKWYLLPTPGTFRRPSLSILRLRGYETPQLLTRSGESGGFSFDSDTAALRLRLVVGSALWFQNAVVYSSGAGS